MPTFPLGQPSFCDDFVPPTQKSSRFTADAGTSQTLITQHRASDLEFTVRYEHLTIADRVRLDNFWLEGTKSNNIPFELPVEVFRHPPEVRNMIWKLNGDRNSWRFKDKYTFKNGQADVDNPCSYYTTSITFVGELDPSAPGYPPTAPELLAKSTFYYRFDDTNWTAAKGGLQYTLAPVGFVANGFRLCGTSGTSVAIGGNAYLRATTNIIGGFASEATLSLFYRNTTTADGQFVIASKWDNNAQRGWQLWLDNLVAGQERIKFSWSDDGVSVNTVQSGALTRNATRMITVQRSVSGNFVRMMINDSGTWITNNSGGIFGAPGTPMALGCTFNSGVPGNYFTGLLDGFGLYPSLLRYADIKYLWGGGELRQL